MAPVACSRSHGGWQGHRRVDKLTGVSAFLRSCFARGLSISISAAVLTTTVIPMAGAATRGTVEPAPTATPAPAVEPTPAAEPTPTAPTSTGHEALVQEGEQLVAAGKHAEGAARLSDAYVLMPAEQRVTDPGRRLVITASNAYEAAWQATADAGQLEANQVLLQAYLADLDTARAAGQPTTPADAQEQALRERSEGIDRMLAEVHPPAEPAPVVAPVLDPATIEPQVELTFPPPDPRLRRNALVLVGVGAAGAVVGGIMVIAGAVTASRAEEQRSGTPAEEATDARRSKTSGTILATTGALVFSGSVMMLGVGSNRLGDLRRELALTLRPSIGGVVLRGRF